MTPEEEFAEALRLRRKAAGLSLGGLSRLVNYSKSYLSRVENGSRTAGPALARECDTALHAEGELLGLLPDRTAAPEGPRRSGRSGQSGQRRSGPVPGARARRAAPDGTDGGGVAGASAASVASGGTAVSAGSASGPAAGPGSAGALTAFNTFGAEFDQLIRRGDARHLLGDMYEAGRLYLAAYRAAEGDDLARAYAIVRCARRWSDPGQVDRDLIARIDECLRMLAGREDLTAVELRLRLTAHRAKKLTMGVGDDTAVPGAEPGTSVDRARGALRELRGRLPGITAETHCEVLTECRWALYDFAPAGELLALSTELRDVATRSRSMYFIGEALVALAIDQLRVGRVTAADATVRRHREHAAHRHSTLARWQQGTLDALMNLWQGEFAAAEEWILGESRTIAEAMEENLSVPADTLSQTCLGQAYWLRHEQGRMADLFGSPLMTGVRRRDYFPVWRAGLALALCETGRHEQAADQVLAFAADTGGFTGFPPNGWALPTAAVLAQACAELAARDVRVEEWLPYVPPLRALLDAHPGDLVLAGWPTVLLGPAARFSGLLALVAGEPETALGHLRRAVRPAQHSPAQMARLRLDEARARSSSRSPAVRAKAGDLARTALTTAEELGMAAVARDCREFLRVSPVRP
ncbi:helix-turn-helix transcriptional regulator [Streptomyces sp. A2-16]|uniref:helix-turn-helix domain-containing protein n=1 Tax=Streptomyces sp. A2-16 TaxID=2781734 RepID=UPI001BB03E03|nr:helix-turn-helix transcriptional regulator [Streptomyces sp. A2-16]QUC62837.1 helix-turn-helix transcriptional regulator [Streptomyces sp. A2-16]